MKPRPIQEPLETKSVRLETPLGNIESDSGSHVIDVMSIVIIICIFFFMKKFYETT